MSLKNYIQTLDDYAHFAQMSLNEDLKYRRIAPMSFSRFAVSKDCVLNFLSLMQKFEDRIQQLSEKRKHSLRLKYRGLENGFVVQLAENAIDTLFSLTDVSSPPLNLSFILEREAETILEMFATIESRDLRQKMTRYSPEVIEYLQDFIAELSEVQPDLNEQKSHQEAKGPTAWWLDMPTSEGIDLEQDEFERLILLSRRQRLERGESV